MKKNLIILLFFLLTSCGYQPVYLNKNLKNFEFQEIVFNGEKDINEKIVNILKIKKNNQSKNKLFISSLSRIEETSKDSKGQVKSLKSVIVVEIEIKDNSKKLIQNKQFVKEFSYNNKKSKYELVEYQNSIKNNLIEKIVNEINFYLNL